MFAWRPLLECRAVTVPIQNARLGRKINFARGKIPLGARAPENVYIAFQPRRRPKFDWPSVSGVAAVTKPRRETCWNLFGCPKLANRSQPPYCENIWRRYCCLTSFFPIVDTCLSCEDIAQRSCAMVPKWRLFGSCISSEPRTAHLRPAF